MRIHPPRKCRCCNEKAETISSFMLFYCMNCFNHKFMGWEFNPLEKLHAIFKRQDLSKMFKEFFKRK